MKKILHLSQDAETAIHNALLSILLPSLCFYLRGVAEDPVKVSREQTEEEVEMNLMAETSHLSEYRSVGMIMMMGR